MQKFTCKKIFSKQIRDVQWIMLLLYIKKLYYKPCTITSKTKQTINNEKKKLEKNGNANRTHRKNKHHKKKNRKNP